MTKENRISRYLIGAEIDGEIDYKIVFTKHAVNYRHDFFAGNIPRKPDFIVELPDTAKGLEKFLEKIEGASNFLGINRHPKEEIKLKGVRNGKINS